VPVTVPNALAADALRGRDFEANPRRLLILSHLAEGEMSVGELEQLLRLRQSTFPEAREVARGRAGRPAAGGQDDPAATPAGGSNCCTSCCAADIELLAAAVRSGKRIERRCGRLARRAALVNQYRARN
jgi:DNA-binding transcriptional ArsR family regulator